MSRLTYFAIIIVAGILLLSGCASWLSDVKNSVSGNPTPRDTEGRTPAAWTKPKSVAIRDGNPDQYATRAAAQQVPGANQAPDPRQQDARAANGYRRSGVDPWTGAETEVAEGSLWDSGKASSYLFVKNTFRQVGDLLVVKVEPEINDNLNAKIAELIAKREKNQQTLTAPPLPADPKKEIEKVAKEAADKAIEKAVDKIAEKVGADPKPASVPTERYVDVDEMTVRLARALPRGAFQVEGTKRILIKGAPYQLRLSGIVKSEDISPKNEVLTSRVLESRLELTR